MKLGWALLGCVIFVGCGDDDGATDAGLDAGAVDGGGVAALDGGGADIDAEVDEAGVGDAATDSSESESESDAGVHDAAIEDVGPPGCDYAAETDVVVRCDGDYRFVGRFASSVEGCEPFWGFSSEGPRFDSAEAAIGSDPSCDAGCIYAPRTAVTRTCSGVRTGYEHFVATDCPDLYRFPAGWYGSVAEHDAENPCE